MGRPRDLVREAAQLFATVVGRESSEGRCLDSAFGTPLSRPTTHDSRPAFLPLHQRAGVCDSLEAERAGVGDIGR